MASGMDGDEWKRNITLVTTIVVLLAFLHGNNDVEEHDDDTIIAQLFANQ